MHIKNLRIVLMFITYAVITLAAPVSKDQTKDVAEQSDSDTELVVGTDGVISDGEDSEGSLTESETVVPEPQPTEPTIDDDFELPKTMNWLYTPEEVNSLCDKVIAYMKKVDQQILSVPDEECTFENVIVPYGRLDNELELVINNIDFFQNVSPIKELRDVSETCTNKINDYSVERSMDKKLYGKVAKVIENIKSGKAKAPEDPEDQQLIEFTDADFRKNGLHLSEEKLSELKDLQRKVSDLKNSYSRCVNEAVVYQYFTRDELAGLSEDFFEGKELVTKDGKEVYEVQIDVPTYSEIRNHCSVGSTRKQAFRAYNQRCPENVETLNQIVALRLKIAQLLGFKTHADSVLKYRMAKTPENVMNFLNSLREKLTPLAKKEMAKLLELKKAELEELNQPADDTFNEWDLNYYNSKLIEKEYDVNFEEVKKYFPMAETTDEMLKLYQELFSLKFEETKSENVWHPDVRQLSVYDKESDRFLGTIYLDLYPREGKYNHFAHFGLNPGFEREDGTFVYPVGSLVTNFPKPTATKPSLLTHDDVVTYFHEFGHAIHKVVSRHKWSRLSGYYVERDFVEAPSQMNENWCWEKEILKRISHHYEDTSKSLPDDLIEKIIRTRNVDSALFNVRQLHYGFIDMKIHYTESVEGLDVSQAYNDLQKEILPYHTDDQLWGIATFAHLVGGYDAGYYGYLYSEVFAADMYFSEFRKDGIIVNPEVGKRYRQLVLEKGSTKPALELLKDFLGREPNDEAFVRNLGI